MAQESPSVTCLSQRQVFAQRQIERLSGNKKVIIHACRARTRAKLFDMSIDFGSIRGLRVFRDDFNPTVGFEIDEDGWPLHCRSDLLRIKNLKEDHFVAAETQWRDVGHDRFRLLIEVRNDDGDTSPMKGILKVPERLGKICLCARGGLFQPCEEPRQLSRPRRRANVLAHFLVEDDEPGRVPLIVNGEIEERRRKVARVVYFAGRTGGESHGVAGVEQDRELAVGLPAITFEVAAFCACEKIPVHVTQVISRRIGAVLGKLQAEPELGGAMQTGDEAVHNRFCQQIERGYASQHFGIEKTLHQPSPNRGTCATSCLRISSASMRSDSAWKLRIMR